MSVDGQHPSRAPMSLDGHTHPHDDHPSVSSGLPSDAYSRPSLSLSSSTSISPPPDRDDKRSSYTGSLTAKPFTPSVAGGGGGGPSQAALAAGADYISLSEQPEAPPLVDASFDEDVLRALCTLDCSVPLMTDRLKQDLAATKEVAGFLKRRAAVEDEYGRKLLKTARSTAESYALSDGKAGSFVNAWSQCLRIHERMGENRVRYASRLREMADDLGKLSAETERARQTHKDAAESAEADLRASEQSTEKAKLRLDGSADELERLLLAKEGESAKDGVQIRPPGAGGTGKRALGKATALLKGRGPAAIQRQEEDVRTRLNANGVSYNKSMEDTQKRRQEYFGFHLPRTLRALKEASDEIDLGTQYHLQRYAFLTESIVMADGQILAPTTNTIGKDGKEEDNTGLQAALAALDYRADFRVYMQNYAYAHGGTAKGPRRTGPEHEGFLPPLPQHVPSPRTALPTNGFPPPPTSASSTTTPLPPPPPLQIPPRATFGIPLSSQLLRDNAEIPPILIKLTSFIEKYGLLSQGIYRLSGTMSKINKLKGLLDEGLDKVDLDREEWKGDVNNVASAAKAWFRELPEGVMTDALRLGFLDAAAIENDRLRHIRLHERINDLPDANYATLKFFLGHLSRIAQHADANQMSVGNLAIVFGPTLFGSPAGAGQGSGGGGELVLQNKAIETILEHYADIFIDEGEAEQPGPAVP
ncbi:RhoGAP-domain-containing protein [Peniophora sp. CONT]|nr:RhoGAP-domain-containing protein [Peniophora sp. CONT]